MLERPESRIRKFRETPNNDSGRILTRRLIAAARPQLPACNPKACPLKRKKSPCPVHPWRPLWRRKLEIAGNMRRHLPDLKS